MTGARPVVVGGQGPSMILRRERIGPEDGRLEVWSLFVTLADDAGRLIAETSIWLGPHGVEQSLADFFQELRGTGWGGTKRWVGWEGGLTLSCTRDDPERVQIGVTLNQLSGMGWEESSVVALEPVELVRVVDELRALLTVHTQ